MTTSTRDVIAYLEEAGFEDLFVELLRETGSALAPRLRREIVGALRAATNAVRADEAAATKARVA